MPAASRVRKTAPKPAPPLGSGKSQPRSRMHAASITDSIAPVLIITGLVLQAGLSLASVKLVAILLFLLMTGPTASNALASAALLAGTRTEQAKPYEAEKPE